MNKEKPIFSIITPTFNGEDFINRTIESVVNQTYGDFEFIIIDDGSKDNTPNILKTWKLKDSRIKIITIKGFGEPIKPMNMAIEASNGKYTTFLDHDDTWEKDKLELILKCFNERKPDLIISSVILSDGKTSEISRLEKNDTNNLISGKYFNTFSAIAVNKSLFESIGFIDNNMLVLSDYELIIRTLSGGKKIFYLDEALATHYFHGNNLSSPHTSQEKRIKDLLYILVKHKKFFNKHKKSKAYILGVIARIYLSQGKKTRAFVYFLKSSIIYPLDGKNVFKALLSLSGENNYQKIKNKFKIT